MNEVSKNLQSTLASIEDLAKTIASEFMARRSGTRKRGEDWSDMIIKVATDSGNLKVEWRKRIWAKDRNANSKRGYFPKYLPDRAVLKSAEDWERDEVRVARERLKALKESHTTLKRMERAMTKLGLTLDDADRQAGFVPTDPDAAPRDADGRFKASKKRKADVEAG